MSSEKIIYKAHTGNSFLVEHDGVAIGAVTLAEDEQSWYGEYICAVEGPDVTAIWTDRRLAANNLVMLHDRGLLGKWEG